MTPSVKLLALLLATPSRSAPLPRMYAPDTLPDTSTEFPTKFVRVFPRVCGRTACEMTPSVRLLALELATPSRSAPFPNRYVADTFPLIIKPSEDTCASSDPATVTPITLASYKYNP